MPEQSKFESAKHGAKASFDWAWKKLDVLGGPVNKISNKLGSEAFWPTDIGRESDKAARILRSFCKDGAFEEVDEEANKEGIMDKGQDVEIKGKQRVIKKIPEKVIQEAVGLCIFTTMRTGLWISGAGGSGVLVARLPNGSWSPPSGVLLHTAGLGFLAGIDIYDCVVVINTEKALMAFETPRFTLGGELSAVAGPAGMGGLVETELHKRQAPVFSYIKSRGLYAGVQIDGSVIIERTDENEKFYGQRFSCREILSGKVEHPPPSTKTLIETIRAAQGSSDINTSLLPTTDTAPSDMELAPSTTEHLFGVPAPSDADPFGVRALKQTGLEIHEAGTGAKPLGEEFEFNPAPTSPVFTSAVGGRSSGDHGGHKSTSSIAAALAERTSRPSSTASVEHATQAKEGKPEMGSEAVKGEDMHADGDMSAPDEKEVVEKNEKVAREEVSRERDEFSKTDDELEEIKLDPVEPVAPIELADSEAKEEGIGSKAADETSSTELPIR